MEKNGVLLYGANGYTGRLIVEAAVRDGVPLAVAGRRREAVEPIAREHGLPLHVFPLEDAAATAAALRPYRALLLAAGPFSHTSAPAVAACLSTGTHYLDITGEIAVFEAVFARDRDAKAAGVVLLPGTGFDVVPSDCLAVSLKEALPAAVRLELAFRGFKTSAGTARTMVEGLPKGSAARIGGKLVPVPAAWKTREVAFPDKRRLVVSIPWGDLSTAWRSTGIPDITTYMAMPPRQATALRWGRPLIPLLGLSPVQSLLTAAVGRFVSGPTAEERARERSVLWGRVEDASGNAVEGTLETLEGYLFTAEAALRCARRVAGGTVAPGAWTPGQAFGGRFVEEIPTTRLRVPA